MQTEWNNPLSAKLYADRQNTIAPSGEELVFYRQYARQAAAEFPQSRALVLGATPELRDLGLNCGLEVTAVDINPKMIELADRLLAISDRRRERVIVKDWLKIDFPPGCFAAVFGDVSLNNITAENVPILLNKISTWLVRGGYVLLRNIVLPEKENDITRLPADLKLWREKKIGTREFYFRFRFGHGYACAYDQEKKFFDAAKEYEWLDRLLAEGVLTQNEHAEINARRGVYVHTVLPVNEFLNYFEKYFKVKKICAEVPETYGFYPVKMFCGQKI